MRRYSGDPYWTRAMGGQRCKCGAVLQAGEEVFKYPRTRTLCGKRCGCGDRAAADFAACAFDEAVYSGQF